MILWNLHTFNDDFESHLLGVFTTDEKAKKYAEGWLNLFYPDHIPNWEFNDGTDAICKRWAATFADFDVWIDYGEEVDPIFDNDFKEQKLEKFG